MTERPISTAKIVWMVDPYLLMTKALAKRLKKATDAEVWYAVNDALSKYFHKFRPFLLRMSAVEYHVVIPEKMSIDFIKAHILFTQHKNLNPYKLSSTGAASREGQELSKRLAPYLEEWDKILPEKVTLDPPVETITVKPTNGSENTDAIFQKLVLEKLSSQDTKFGVMFERIEKLEQQVGRKRR